MDEEIIVKNMGQSIDSGLKYSFQNEDGNVASGLFAIAEALHSVAEAIIKLGFNNASTPMGAIEGMTCEIKEGLEDIANAIGATIGG